MLYLLQDNVNTGHAEGYVELSFRWDDSVRGMHSHILKVDVGDPTSAWLPDIFELARHRYFDQHLPTTRVLFSSIRHIYEHSML